MIPRLHCRLWASFLFALALLLSSNRIAAQRGGSAGTIQDQIDEFPADVPQGHMSDPVMEMRRYKALNIARQRSMVADAARLVALARQLNSGVAQDGSPLTAEQRLKIATEIEKLARGVKEKMSYAASPGLPAHGGIPAWAQ